MATRRMPSAAGLRSRGRCAARAMRPQEWIKNLLVFAGLLFSGQFDETGAVAAATVTFVAFCAMSSAGYLFNDFHDAELDRQHPEKRRRPIAAGELGVRDRGRVGRGAGADRARASALVGVDAEVGGLVRAYGVDTAAYSLVLKRLVILDVMTIAGLFLLRVSPAPSPSTPTPRSTCCSAPAMLALFLGFTKRRQEAMLEEQRSRTETRARCSSTTRSPSSTR